MNDTKFRTGPAKCVLAAENVLDGAGAIVYCTAIVCHQQYCVEIQSDILVLQRENGDGEGRRIKSV